MQQERWAAVNELFHAALELPPSDRRGFVRSASNGDASLRSEVEQLLEADEHDSSFLETPLIPADAFLDAASSPSPFQPGDVLNGRFRILRQVGEGGMGHVFEAHDSEVGVRVALKVIRPEIAGNPETLNFFRREVRTARTITHAHVCRTYDLSRGRLSGPGAADAEYVFLTMEFLDGETLASLLKRSGALPADQALGIARQIASALDAAHEAGIIHRDIKPANIMLVPAGRSNGGETRAVITDFGLARMDPVISAGETSSISHANRQVGTLAYMAPEQLEGGRVSTVTDVYAFGLLLYEMISGQRAFPADGLLSGIARRLSGSPPLPRASVPEAPEVWAAAWDRAIQGCLCFVPGERFQRAGEAIAMLERAKAGETELLDRRVMGDSGSISIPGSAVVPAKFIVSGPRRLFRSGISDQIGDQGREGTASGVVSAPPERAPWISRGRFLGLGAILVAAMSLFLAGLRLYRSEADAAVAPGALVYLTPVKNQTGERQLDNLTELIQAGLTQSAHINLLDQSRVGDTLQLMTKSPDTAIDEPIAREIAMRTGAVRVVFATVKGSGGKYRLDVDMQQPSSSPLRASEHWHTSVEWDSSTSTNASATMAPELLTSMRHASDWIRSKVGESAQDLARLDVPPEDVTTSNWQALAEYAAAEQFQARLQRANAIFALERAVKLDSSFSTAYGRLGDLLFSTGRYQDGLQAYSQALETDEGLRLTRREHDRILGEFSLDSGDFVSAERAYRDLTISYPYDYRGWYYRGYPLMMAGRFDKAIATLSNAYSLDHSRTNAPWELGRANVSIGNFPEALRWAGVLDEQGSYGLSNYLRGAVAFLSKDFAGAKKAFAAMQKSTDVAEQSWRFLLLARVAAEVSDLSSSLDWLQQGIQFDEQNGLEADEAEKLMARAYVEQTAQRYASCLEDVRASLKLEKSPQRLMTASSVLGAALFKAQAPAAAALRQEILHLKEDLPRDSSGFLLDFVRLRVDGEASLATGDVRAALLQLKKAGDIDAPSHGREYLGRAYEEAAEQETDPNRSSALKKLAMDAYAASALRPNLMWLDSIDAQPGYYATQHEAYARIEKRWASGRSGMKATSASRIALDSKTSSTLTSTGFSTKPN